MSDPTPAVRQPLPPPAPPLPPPRLGPLQRLVAPLGLNLGSRSQDEHSHRLGDHGVRHVTGMHPPPLEGVLPSSQTAAHRTGIPIAALDINAAKTHAILAGKEILKTVCIRDGRATEDFNLRSSIVSYASTHGSPQIEAVGRRREYLPARDVRWSSKLYDHIIATAGNSGRISLYDVNAGGPRIELMWLHEHTGQVNKLDFDSFSGHLLLSASQDKTVKLWDIREPGRTRSIQRFEVRNGVRDVRWSPTDSLDFAVCADGGVIQNWDPRNPLAPKLSINGHEKACYSLDWHPDGRHVVTGGFDKHIKIWDFKSDAHRRQKPIFQLRAPQAIRNVRWRPPCWSAELAESGHWQSTQIATSYHHEDPRIHIWDLRRPLLPFRELDRYNTPANDLLWASKDLLWTVGDEGIFTQTDVCFAPQVHRQIPPCALEWMPDGECTMFFEDRGARRISSLEDPAVGFLSVRQEKLSGEDDGAASRSFVDDDDSAYDNLLSGTFRRRQSKATSSRSAKSQANTPPTAENTPSVLSLDRAILDKVDLFNNYQVGASGLILGVAEEADVVEFLATNYAAIATESERMTSPRTVLQRLEESFNRNADVCDEASLHRMAQSWRMLGAVIVPELREWADSNRIARKAEAASIRTKRESTQTVLEGSRLSPLAKLPARGKDGKAHKAISNLFRGILEAEKGNLLAEQDSSSGMTTPLAKPLPDSPQPVRKQFGSPDVGDNIENIQPLPPSLLNSHSTAAAAAKALFDSSSIASDTPPSSPESRRQQRNTVSSGKTDRETWMVSGDDLRHTMNAVSSQLQKQSSASLVRRQDLPQSQKQEERRAALRDYRAQARPIFTLEEPIRSPNYGRSGLNDSSESFPMFSASTDSSHKARSLGQSFESPKATTVSSEVDDNLRSREAGHDLVPSMPASEESARRALPGQHSNPKSLSTSNSLPNFGLDGTTDFNFGLDGSNESKERQLQHLEDTWSPAKDDVAAIMLPNETAASSSPEIFQFDAHSPPKPRIYTFNPVRDRTLNPDTRTKHKAQPKRPSIELADDEMSSEEYIFKDFRPIDLSKYESKLPFAWSSLPLMCQIVAFDMDNGIAHAQFSTHLLMHLSPYFFHERYRSTTRSDDAWPETVAERLLRPDFSHRVIEGLFLKHLSYLRQMQLFNAAAVLRKSCAELCYPRVLSLVAEQHEGSSLSKGDPSIVAVACAFCQTPMSGSQNLCTRCRKPRSVCPICLSLNHQASGPKLAKRLEDGPVQGQRLWAHCQACGHSAHSMCMEEWFSQSYNDGACPTQGCGCDCGPGTVRKQRIARQMKSIEENKLIRGGGTASAKKDSLRVAPSPAVDKTRAVLRGAAGDRATQSGDERGLSARRAGHWPSAGGFGSQRKSVRLVTPGEESSPK